MYVPDTSHGNKNKMMVKSFNRSYKYHLSVGVFIASSWALTPALFFSSSVSLFLLLLDSFLSSDKRSKTPLIKNTIHYIFFTIVVKESTKKSALVD